MPPLLTVSQASKVFGGVRALDRVDFSIDPGEIHCLAGENGCGKSTLIKIITGVYQPEPGATLRFNGERINTINPTRSRRLGIEVIWQDLALFPEMTVAENIAFEQMLGRSFWPRPVSHRALRRAAEQAQARLDIDFDLDAPLRQLPIAQRQLVAVCRALTGAPRLIFMDEPTASLTQAETERLLTVVRKLSADGVAVVFVSHRLAEVLAIANRVTVLRDGRLVGVFNSAEMTQSRLTELMTGRTFDTAVSTRQRPRSAKAPPVLTTQGLTRAGEYSAIDLQVHAGEIVGLTGLIGAGRTELALSLFGMTRPDSGTIRLNGRPVKFRSNRDAIDAGVAYVSEDRLTLGLVQPQSISDNLALPVLDRLLNRLKLLSPRAQSALSRHWINQLAVKIGAPHDPVSTLSGGNQQRIVLAKWLASQPRLLILDAPTVGVDVGARAGIFDIVRRLAGQGLAIVLISDEVPEVYFHADRVLHMAGGRIVADYDPRQVELAAIEQAVYA